MGMRFFGGLFPKKGAVGARQRGAGGGPPGQRGAGGLLSGQGAALEVRVSGSIPVLLALPPPAAPWRVGGVEADWVGLGAADRGPHPRRVPGTMGSAPARGEGVVSQSSSLPGFPAFCYSNSPPALGPLPILPLPPALLSLTSAWEKRNPAVN